MFRLIKDFFLYCYDLLRQARELHDEVGTPASALWALMLLIVPWFAFLFTDKKSILVPGYIICFSLFMIVSAFNRDRRQLDRIKDLSANEIVPRLVMLEGENYFIVENNTGEDISDFELKLHHVHDLKPIMNTVLVADKSYTQQTDCVHLATLIKGQRRQWFAFLAVASNGLFDAEWKWKTKDGKVREKRGQIAKEVISGRPPRPPLSQDPF